MHFILPKLDAFGAYSYDPESRNRIILSDENLKSALENMKQLTDALGAGFVNVSETGIPDESSCLQDFGAGKLPLCYIQTGEQLQIQEAGNISCGFVAVPSPSDTSGYFVTALSSPGFFINRNIDKSQQSAAEQYIEFLLSDIAQTDLYADGWIMVNKNVSFEKIFVDQSNLNLELSLKSSLPYIRFYEFAVDSTVFLSIGDFLSGRITVDEQIAKLKSVISQCVN